MTIVVGELQTSILAAFAADENNGVSANFAWFLIGGAKRISENEFEAELMQLLGANMLRSTDPNYVRGQYPVAQNDYCVAPAGISILRASGFHV